MTEFKIKHIKNLNDAKNIFNFISNAFFMDGMKVEEEFLPLHELYDIMLDNLSRDKDLQFYGVLNKNIVSAIVCSPAPQEKTTLVINIIHVRNNIRQMGIGNYMLAQAEMLAKRKGYKKIRIICHNNFQMFFLKHNYKLFLELAIPETLPMEDVLKINNLNLQYSSLIKFNDINFVLYPVDQTDNKIKYYISRNTPLVKANYILEKTFLN